MIALYYDPAYEKKVRSTYWNPSRQAHLDKYKSVHINGQVIKPCNLLILKHGSIKHTNILKDILNNIYNPNKNNLYTYTQENYPELYV